MVEYFSGTVSAFSREAVTAYLIAATHVSLVCLAASFVFSNFIGTSSNLNVPSSSFTLSKNCLTVWNWLKSFFLMQSICFSVGEEKWCNLIYIFQLRGVDIILAGTKTSADKHARLVFKPFFTFDNLWIWHILSWNRTCLQGWTSAAYKSHICL